MKLINSNNINFQKRLLANVSVLKGQKTIPCKIYSLNTIEDRDYFRKIEDDDTNWEDAPFIEHFEYNIYKEIIPENSKMIVLEDNKGNLLSASISTRNNELDYIVSRPKTKYDSKRLSNIKYAGETLLAFLVKKASNEGVDDYIVNCPLDKAIPFYKKCLFDIKPRNFIAVLKEYNKEDFITQNEIHTKSKIDFIS